MGINLARFGSILAALSAVWSSGIAVIAGLASTPVFAFCAAGAFVVAFENIRAGMNPHSALHVFLAILALPALFLDVPLFVAMIAYRDPAMVVVLSIGLTVPLKGALVIVVLPRDHGEESE